MCVLDVDTMKIYNKITIQKNKIASHSLISTPNWLEAIVTNDADYAWIHNSGLFIHISFLFKKKKFWLTIYIHYMIYICFMVDWLMITDKYDQFAADVCVLFFFFEYMEVYFFVWCLKFITFLVTNIFFENSIVVDFCWVFWMEELIESHSYNNARMFF